MSASTLSEMNAALLERLYEFGKPLPALFVFSREALNELMDAARSEGHVREWDPEDMLPEERD